MMAWSGLIFSLIQWRALVFSAADSVIRAPAFLGGLQFHSSQDHAILVFCQLQEEIIGGSSAVLAWV